MMKILAVGLWSGIALLMGTAMLAAPGQNGQGPPTRAAERPGQMTKGQVWIENRGRTEAVPIAAPDPIPVVVRNPVRLWDYQVLSVMPDTPAAELTRMLTASDNVGWEVAGAQLTSGPQTLLVMKRLRPGPEASSDTRPDARQPPR